MNIRDIKGIGEKSEKVFNKAGVYTVDDLLKYYPRTYDIFEPPSDVSGLKTDRVMAVTARTCNRPTVIRVKNMTIVRVILEDAKGQKFLAQWFNAPYIGKTAARDGFFVFRGRISKKDAVFVMTQPKIYERDNYLDLAGTWQPVYPLVRGLKNRQVVDAVRRVLKYVQGSRMSGASSAASSSIPGGFERAKNKRLPEAGAETDPEALETEKDVTPAKDLTAARETLPASLLKSYDLCAQEDAIRNIHFPKDQESFLRARRRLVFNEFFFFIYTLKQYRKERTAARNLHPVGKHKEIETIIKELPYKLTKAQEDAINDIQSDLSSGHAMNRLLQGDVGSGKTIVAVLAMFSTALSGSQAVIMAPTEVLAKQHFKLITGLIEKHHLPFRAVFLSGSLTASEKRAAYASVANDPSVLIIVGTHAVFQEKVIYRDLALVVTDEQHRFGVRQREAIGSKGKNPHILVMSATPIPRTLAVILYGDLDISVIAQLPSERLPVKNCVVGPEFRPNAYRFIRKQIAAGHQAYIVCPSIETNDEWDVANVTEYAAGLYKFFPSTVKIATLHGKMSAVRKNEVMELFAAGDIDILVATTVIEVGVNVPGATVMMVENAERFGLAQLHQLRGRVGRGKDQSYCIFINTSESEEARTRLNILLESNDGFYIAREDLKMRGPGDFFGARQSGDPAFKLADIYADAPVIQQANEAAQKLDKGAFPVTKTETARLSDAALAYSDLPEERISL